jgi:hypothetical protein
VKLTPNLPGWATCLGPYRQLHVLHILHLLSPVDPRSNKQLQLLLSDLTLPHLTLSLKPHIQ